MRFEKFAILLDTLVHAVPVLPKKLQGSKIDKLWERLMDKKEGIL